MKTKIGVLIPAYNESQSILRVINEIEKLPIVLDILVVDDGSDDNTCELAAKAGVFSVRHSLNCGVGAAVITGLTWFTRRGYEKIVIIDADNQHPVNRIPDLLLKLKTSEVVVGTRDWKAYSSNPVRRFAHLMLKTLLRFRFGIHLDDVTSGFRAMRGYVAKSLIPLLEYRYLEDTIMFLVHTSKLNYSIDSVKVLMNKRELGVPSHNLFRSSIRYLSILVKLVVETRGGKNGI